MRFVACCLFLLACDLQPPPKKQAPPPPPTTEPATAPGDAAGSAAVIADAGPEPAIVGDAAPTPVLGDAGSAAPPPPPADAGLAMSKECEQVAIHVADVAIASTKDPTQKAQYEQDRTKLVRTVGEVCTVAKWSEQARKCLLDAKTDQDIMACRQLIQPGNPEQ
ncbi:MAG TPA: hypothetical protein VFQ53_12920 [Kofleriaceae bacterium]|nr:hypothetical protein [Kofleriaceae bacterium]